MRVDSLKLPQAAQQHSRVHGSDKAFPGFPAEKANEAATAKHSPAENIAATATATDSSSAEKSKLTPSGLLAAQLRFQGIAEADRTHGQSRALEVITRNLSRYQTESTVVPTSVEATTPPVDPVTETTTEATEPTTSSQPVVDASPSEPNSASAAS